MIQFLSQNNWLQSRRHEISEGLYKLGIQNTGIDTSNLRTNREILEKDLAERLSVIGLSLNLKRLEIIEKLINIVADTQDERNQKKAAWCLELVLHDFLPSVPNESYPNLVTSLKRCIESLPEKDQKKRALISIGTQEPALACYKGLWNISDFLDFKSFYKAWYS
ncbi:hypothetical protein VB780_03165 [Leptolyngbya sp. CCNP1308]|uniref:hypothetical protein n=1 Tax=Leptolyngbya sp. CCNP1308 TaxID=3110255 RepID=UPI002B1F1BFD|nr:hypothetical protein [Leptolyngbya sp. CCNP1308]MEA5447554.1 hypothetical protein [Leptolyngbya sp. CCNP1308]